MNRKQIIAVLLSVVLVMAIAAGCEMTIGNCNTQRETGGLINLPNINPDEVPDLNDAQAREDFRNKHGLDENLMVTLPPGVTELITEPPPPPLTTMPAGNRVQASEVYPLMRNAFDIMGSDRFYMSGRISADTGFGSGPIVVARDGNRMMQEMTMDWSQLAQSPGNDFGVSRAQAAILTTTFGRRFRMIITPDGPVFAFPDRNTFIDATAVAQMDENAGDFEMPEDFELDFFGALGGTRDIPQDVDSSRVTVGNREYLCATLSEGSETVKYYFHNGDLRRMEAISRDPQGNSFEIIIEFNELHTNPPANLFTTQGMRRAPLTDLMNLGNLGGGSLFG